MDLSGLIFVVLAVGWAVVLIPMALKRHDDEALTRPVETFSDAVRVLGRGTSTASAPATERAPARLHTVSREAARGAARRRRRVLAVLLLALVVVSVTSYLGYTPRWSSAVPAGLVVAFLVTARLTVRAQQVRRAAPVQPSVPSAAETPVAVPVAQQSGEIEPDLGREDTVGVSREELAAAVAAPALDEGSLWDPLPVTLPTYVNKAPAARRTVRTVEITGMTSSGHDAADSALAREAEAASAEAKAAQEAAAEDRKAAGA